MKFLLGFLKKAENKIILAISLLLGANTYFFIERKSTNAFPLIFDNVRVHYLLYFLGFLTAGVIFYKYYKIFKIKNFLQYWLLFFIPTELAFIWGLFISHDNTKVQFVFYFLTGFYLVFSAIFFIETRVKLEKSNLSKKTIRDWFKKQGLAALFILLISISTFSYFTLNKIENYAGVDEPLWTFDRIHGFWRNIESHDWWYTAISDKPGITVAIISGIGLWFENPDNYEKLTHFDPQKDIRQMNLAFRLPLAIFCILSLFLFYIFIQELLGKNIALISLSLISTSPILIGISRIINPDAILWIFVCLTFLAYLVFLKKKTRFWLYTAGILMGLSILTKYVANILYVLFFGLIFINYLFLEKKPQIKAYLKESFLNFASFIFISLVVIFFLFPKTWIALSKLFTTTILSQAFAPIAPLFIFLLIALFIDSVFLKNKISAPIMDFLRKQKKYLLLFFIGLFTLFLAVVVFNVLFSMHWINFEEILKSPKSAYKINSIFSIFTTNFYPLIYTSLPIALLGTAAAIFYFFKNYSRQNDSLKLIFLFIFFILLYYTGTTFNSVVSTIRYQVVLFPVFLVISAIGIQYLADWIFPKKYSTILAAILVLAIGIFTLAKNKPFYLGYASNLLPKKYAVDFKDMGDGSYETAQFLNSLPDAKNLFVWTDKTGVCQFFVGKCDSFFDALSFQEAPPVDYFVVSSGRENKIITNTRSHAGIPYDFEKIYQSKNYAFSIFINNRKNNYIKVLKMEKDFEINSVK